MLTWNKPARARLGDPLTPRGLEVLDLVASGQTTPQIAARVGIAPDKHQLQRPTGALPPAHSSS